jgi:hypothetical protein
MYYLDWPSPDVATMSDYIIELIITKLLNKLQVSKNEDKPHKVNFLPR